MFPASIFISTLNHPPYTSGSCPKSGSQHWILLRSTGPGDLDLPEDTGSYGSSVSGIFFLENVRCSELFPSIFLFQSLPLSYTSSWILDPQDLFLPRSHRCCLPFPNKLLLILYISASESLRAEKITAFQSLCSNLNS